MAENELIQTIADNLPISGEDEIATAARVLAVVREHDAARVPADAELDGLMWRLRHAARAIDLHLDHSADLYVPVDEDEAMLDAASAIVDLRSSLAKAMGRVAALESERDKLRRSFKAACGEADHFKRALHEAIGADLAPSDAQEGRTDG